MSVRGLKKPGLGRQLSYQVQKLLLQRRFMLADDLPHGMKFRFRTPDDVGRHLFKYKTYEPHILEFLESHADLQEGSLVLDIGANLGWYSVLAQRLSGGNAEVHAFEPDPDNARLLTTNISLNDSTGIHVAEIALSDTSGSASLHRYRSINLGKHSLHAEAGGDEKLTVTTTSLDQYMNSHGLHERSVDLVKIDAEGLEPAIIRGSSDTLSRVGVLVLEYSPMYYQRKDSEDMVSRLDQAGFQPLMYEKRWKPVSPAAVLALEEQKDTIWLARPVFQRFG